MDKKSSDMLSYKNDNVHIFFKQVQRVPDRVVRLADACKIHCQDNKIEAGCRNLVLYRFKDGEEKHGCNILDAVALIENRYPGITVNSDGVPEFLLEYQGTRHESKYTEFLKTVFVCLITFCGAAFAIMTFNNDGDILEIFSQLYEQFTGNKSNGFTVLEAGYSIGLPLGLLIFFNHFSLHKDINDPTPLEVEMRIYGDDLAASVIEKEERAKEKS